MSGDIALHCSILNKKFQMKDEAKMRQILFNKLNIFRYNRNNSQNIFTKCSIVCVTLRGKEPSIKR